MLEEKKRAALWQQHRGRPVDQFRGLQALSGQDANSSRIMGCKAASMWCQKGVLKLGANLGLTPPGKRLDSEPSPPPAFLVTRASGSTGRKAGRGHRKDSAPAQCGLQHARRLRGIRAGRCMELETRRVGRCKPWVKACQSRVKISMVPTKSCKWPYPANQQAALDEGGSSRVSGILEESRALV